MYAPDREIGAKLLVAQALACAEGLLKFVAKAAGKQP
jgi:hypothetical protein